MSQELNVAFGRLESPDERDNDFPMSAMLTESPVISKKMWWADGWWGDQGQKSECVAFSWLHFVEDGPVIQDGIKNRQKPLLDPTKFYTECQHRDRWPGNSYNGSSVRAGAKVLKDLGIITEYRWAQNVQDIINALLMLGPVVVGTRWNADMMKVDKEGLVKITGNSMGGHAYLLNGVDVDKGIFRIKNSWGQQKWGINGHGYIRIEDYEKLHKMQGEACIAYENKIVVSPDWTKLRPPGVYTD